MALFVCIALQQTLLIFEYFCTQLATQLSAVWESHSDDMQDERNWRIGTDPPEDSSTNIPEHQYVHYTINFVGRFSGKTSYILCY